MSEHHQPSLSSSLPLHLPLHTQNAVVEEVVDGVAGQIASLLSLVAGAGRVLRQGRRVETGEESSPAPPAEEAVLYSPSLLATSPFHDNVNDNANANDSNCKGDNSGNCKGDNNGNDDENWQLRHGPDDHHTRLHHMMQHAIHKEKLAAAIFSHPNSLKSYCLDAYQAAQDIVRARAEDALDRASKHDDSALQTKPRKKRGRKNNSNRRQFQYQRLLVHLFFRNVPLSIMWDLVEGTVEVSIETVIAVIHLSAGAATDLTVNLLDLLQSAGTVIAEYNPLELVQIVITRPFNAVMGKSTEAGVGGIQSVATGVCSSSSMAFRNLNTKPTPSSSRHPSSQFLNTMANPKVNTKLLKKLSMLNSTASVVSYKEIADDTGGLSHHAKSRVQRMMHYAINLRPFVATIKLPIKKQRQRPSPPPVRPANNRATMRRSESSSSSSSASSSFSHSDDTAEGHDSDSTGSPFMCTPQSFPATPTSRRRVLARGSRFSDDVLFLARDQLRVHDALDSNNERTREMAMALAKGRRLAVFDADDTSTAIDLTCGQHVATKVGNMLYGSTRSMVPILRNCFVYFEMTVLPRNSGPLLIPQASMATLSIGLSTKEMPPNTLVGAWQGSVGLCTTGQLLTAGQWCSPADPSSSAYGDRATVGCLVCLDDGSAFETWDGVMVTAAVTFTVNGKMVSPPLSSQPFNPPSAGNAMPATPPPPIPPIAPPVPPSFTLPLLVPAEEELYPTVTLHSPGVAVLSRFSEGDLLSTTRQAIGAPSGVTVYCVDGSVILDETDP